MTGKRYYDLLGLPENSTDQEVKKRFRILAKQYHPDVNPDADATQVFATLLDAYERILTKNFSERRTSASTSPHNNNREDEQRDFHRRAWERYQQMEQEKKEALDAFYVSFLKGPKMRIKKVLAFVTYFQRARCRRVFTLSCGRRHDTGIRHHEVPGYRRRFCLLLHNG